MIGEIAVPAITAHARRARLLAAFDRGYGRRCNSHHRENPFDPVSDADRHQSYEDGFQAADDEAYGRKRAAP